MDINLIKGAIFDMDGTLLDSMSIWDSAATDYLISRGAAPRPGLFDEMLTLGGHEIPQYFQAEYGIYESEEEIRNGIYQLLEEYYFFKVPLKPGVTAVLDTMRDKGVKMCVATATDRELVEPALHRCGIIEYFGRIFTCGEERTSKSSPDIYLRAAAFLGTDIADTLVVEDAPYAIKSAENAGFPVAAIYDIASADKQDEIKEICEYYFQAFDEMLSLLHNT